MSKMFNKLYEACGKQGSVVIILAAMLCASFVYKEYIDSKYNRKTEVHFDKEKGFQYSSAPSSQDKISGYIE